MLASVKIFYFSMKGSNFLKKMSFGTRDYFHTTLVTLPFVLTLLTNYFYSQWNLTCTLKGYGHIQP